MAAISLDSDDEIVEVSGAGSATPGRSTPGPGPGPSSSKALILTPIPSTPHSSITLTPPKASTSIGTYPGAGMFTKEIRCMLYGFGDSASPYKKTVDLVEELVVQFVSDLVLKALEVGKPNKVQIEDLVFVLRKDRSKFSRVRELLTVNEELKKARKAIKDLGDVPAT